MRTFICGTVLAIAIGMTNGCGSSMSAKTAASATTQADQLANSKTCMMQSSGVNVLKLKAPGDIKCVAEDGSLHLTAPQYEVEFWMVRGVQTVDEATLQTSSQIATEFKDFKPERTTTLNVAGLPAKRVVGTGHEADDGDPGDADVIVFKVGEHVFIACNHGESLNPVGQQGMLTMVQTAQLP